MGKGLTSIHLQSQWLYLAFVLTLFAMLAYDWLPTRKLPLLDENTSTSIYMDSRGSGSSEGVWVNQSKHHFRCTFTPVYAPYKFCGFNIPQGDGDIKGVDFSAYKNLNFKINYAGNSELIRFYLRDFIDGYSDTNDSRNTSQYLRMHFPARDLMNGITVPLNQFTVAEWWIRSLSVPAEKTFPKLNNIVNLGIDYPYPVTVGSHEIQVEYIYLEGPLLSKETWYLSIFAFWFLLLVLKNLQQLYLYRKLLSANTRELDNARTKASQLEQESNRYRELSLVDQLTCTLNRRGIQREIALLEENNLWEGTAMLLVDIDHFKPVNDNYGHDVGDRILETFGHILNEFARTQDCVGRWGGEEFILLYPSTQPHSASVLAEKIRQRVEQTTFASELNLKITASFGVGTTKDSESFEDCFKRVDRALYQAKEMGRNKVLCAAL